MTSFNHSFTLEFDFSKFDDLKAKTKKILFYLQITLLEKQLENLQSFSKE